MPIQTLITLLAVVIALAAVTVAGLLFLTGASVGTTTLASISIVALLATVAVRRLANRDH